MYLPGPSVRLPMRPENLKAFGPAEPATVKLPFTGLSRAHLALPRLAFVCFTHFFPALRAGALRWALKVTPAGAVREKKTVAPPGAFLRFLLITAPPRFAAT